MDSLYNWSDATKMGVGLTALGTFFTFFGIIMLLDRVLLTMGNLLFVGGVALIMGTQRFSSFFTKRRRASGCFFFGMVLVLAGWCLLGLLLQGFGALNLFGNFFPVIARVLEAAPLIGPAMRSAPVQYLLQRLNLSSRYNRNI